MAKKTNVPSVPKKKTNVPCAPTNEIVAALEKQSNYLAPYEKARTMCLQLYCSPDRWADVLNDNVKYIYIYHDKDTATPHYHLILHYSSPRYRRAIEKQFDLTGLTEDTTINFQRCKRFASAVKYLLHETNEARKANKHLYDVSELVSNDLQYFLNRVDDCEEVTNSVFLDDLLSDNFSYRRMAEKYGRDYIKNHRAYTAFKNEVIKEEALEMARLHRREAKEELLSTLSTTDNSIDMSDTACIARYIIDNIAYSPMRLDAGSPRYRIEEFLKDIKNICFSEVDE